jgi:hypothetical protein
MNTPMDYSPIKEKMLAEKFREEIEAIQECWHCHTSRLIGAITSPSPDGKNGLIYCLNHKKGGIILSRFDYNPAQ